LVDSGPVAGVLATSEVTESMTPMVALPVVPPPLLLLPKVLVAVAA